MDITVDILITCLGGIKEDMGSSYQHISIFISAVFPTAVAGDSAVLVFSGEHRLQKGYTGWVKNRDSFPIQLLQSICCLGKLQLLSGTLLWCSRWELPKWIAVFQSWLSGSCREQSSQLSTESSGGGALTWGPWVQRVISASPAVKHCSWMTAAGCRQCRWEFMPRS